MAMSSAGQLRVKNTFLHYSGDSDTEKTAVGSLRTRAASDPQIFDGTLSDAAGSECAEPSSDKEGVEFVIRGLSDDEGEAQTDVEQGHDQKPLNCYAHIQEPEEALGDLKPSGSSTAGDTDLHQPPLLHPAFRVVEHRHAEYQQQETQQQQSAGGAGRVPNPSGASGSQGPDARCPGGKTTTLPSHAPPRRKISNKSWKAPRSDPQPERVRVSLESALGPSPTPAPTAQMSGRAPSNAPAAGFPMSSTASSDPLEGERQPAPPSDRTTAADQMARLEAENARLVRESEKLVQQCLKFTAAACSMAMSSVSSSSTTPNLSSASTLDTGSAIPANTGQHAGVVSPVQAAHVFCVPMVMCMPIDSKGQQPQSQAQEQPRQQNQQAPQKQPKDQPLQQNRKQSSRQLLRQQAQLAQQLQQSQQQQLHRPLHQRDAGHAQYKGARPVQPERRLSQRERHQPMQQPKDGEGQGQDGAYEADLDDDAESEDETDLPLCGPSHLPNDNRTTVMLRNLPNNYTRAMLVAMIHCEGYAGQYDFVYLPMDFGNKACLGYAFINLLRHDIALRFWETFSGYSKWIIPSKKQCGVSWSHPHQGLHANIERYRNSPVMHSSVPNEYKPQVYVKGVVTTFPPPTRKLRVPRIRGLKKPSWAA